MTTKLTPHPLANIFHAWADGAKVQSCEKTSVSPWLDEPNPSFSKLYNWRIKPEKVRYRLYLCNGTNGLEVGVMNNKDGNDPDFNEWIGDWVEKEI